MFHMKIFLNFMKQSKSKVSDFMQKTIYCNNCKKDVPYYNIDVIKGCVIEGIKQNYTAEASVCKNCNTLIYTPENIRKNIEKRHEIYWNKVKEEKKEEKKKRRNKVVSGVYFAILSFILGLIIALVKGE